MVGIRKPCHSRRPMYNSSITNIDLLACILRAAVLRRSPLIGRSAHGRALRTLNPIPPFISTHIVNTYSELGLLSSAAAVVSSAAAASLTVVALTSLIGAAVRRSDFPLALRHFSLMRSLSLSPNDFTFPSLFLLSTSLALPTLTSQLHILAVKSAFISDVHVSSSLFVAYSKLNLPGHAHQVFDEMPLRNLVIWNALISLSGRPTDAFAAFVDLRRLGFVPDCITLCAVLSLCSSVMNLGCQIHCYVVRSGGAGEVSVATGLLDFYGTCGRLGCAEAVFDGLSEPDGVCWASMVAACVHNEEAYKGFLVFLEAIRKGVEPTRFLVSSAVGICSSIGGLEFGRSVHALAVKAHVAENVYVGSALVDMYGKCGSLDDSGAAFARVTERNSVTWNALLGGYAHQGRGDAALAQFERMVSSGVAPNRVTFVCVLSACGRAGAVEAGVRVFRSMAEKYGVEPEDEHHACVVDMLGRAGMVERAYELVKNMPFRPSSSVWGALLGACRLHSRPDIGTIAADNLVELEPHDLGNNVLLSNMFADVDRWEDVESLRAEMKEKGRRKDAGCSWVVTAKNTTHVFRMRDGSHGGIPEVREMVDRLTREVEIYRNDMISACSP